jgi:glycosyltransferase involved in cell wall biosynthesis
MVMHEQKNKGHDVSAATWAGIRRLREADEVWIHCGWLPCLWWAVLWGGNIHWLAHGCYDPVRLRYHGWKKWLAGPIERFCLRRASVIIATCEAESGWIRAYEPRAKRIEISDIKRFYNFSSGKSEKREEGEVLHLLYLGRRHPLKGVGFLEAAISQIKTYAHSASGSDKKIELRIVSSTFGAEKERVWDWCDVLVLPSLSENFGLVVAEALERGKRVITTDGAPAWGGGNDYGGRLVYIRGYRDGSNEERIRLLKKALVAIAK